MTEKKDLGSVLTVIDRVPYKFNVEVETGEFDNGLAIEARYHFKDDDSNKQFKLEVTSEMANTGGTDSLLTTGRLDEESIKYALYKMELEPDAKNFSLWIDEYKKFLQRPKLKGIELREAVLRFLFDVYLQWPDQWVTMPELAYNFNSTEKELDRWTTNLAKREILECQKRAGAFGRGSQRSNIVQCKINPKKEEEIEDLLKKKVEAVDTSDPIEVFLSYATANKERATGLKSSLEGYGTSTFVAPYDIPPSEAWLSEIRRHLDRCDVFVPLLSKEFRESPWCDQEAGYAVARDKIIIPLFEDEPPHGFLNPTQGLKTTWEYEKTAREVVESISGKPNLAVRFRDGLIDQLGKARNDNNASEAVERLLLFDGFSKEQLQKIRKHAEGNLKGHECVERLMRWLKKQTE